MRTTGRLVVTWTVGFHSGFSEECEETAVVDWSCDHDKSPAALFHNLEGLKQCQASRRFLRFPMFTTSQNYSDMTREPKVAGKQMPPR